MKYMRKHFLHIYIIALAILSSCQEQVDEDTPIISNNIIRVGGALAEGQTISIVQTRADENVARQRAEDVPWMKGAVLNGLDITYSNITTDGTHNRDNEQVAILKWKGTKNEITGRGDYSFQYKGTTTDAVWYDNGPHYFEGEFVPEELRDGNGNTMGITDLTTDQHDETNQTYNDQGVASGEIGNYTLLSHYLGMPPNWTTSATVDQILLPFKHRLARVIVYILIDEKLLVENPNKESTDRLIPATLNGYKLDVDRLKTGETDIEPNRSPKLDNPMTTDLRFANVWVLDKVEETPIQIHDKTTSALTPVWKQARRVIPHFVDEIHSSVNFRYEPSVKETEADKYKTEAAKGYIVYMNKRDETKIHPGDDEWLTAHKTYVDASDKDRCAYAQQVYTHVPVYDMIVRPTYTSPDSVMYDEAGYYNPDRSKNTTEITKLANRTNSIEFEMTLSNGLTYTKVFSFDLDANHQTVVYISIDRESVDYDSSSSEPWVSSNGNDYYYGVNNDLGHNLSIAGSSWQRAYSNGTYDHGVTDGNTYHGTETDEGEVGQYVSESKWIECFKQAVAGDAHHGDYFILEKDIKISGLPDNFVFTGHLDARGHTITIEGKDHLFDGLNAIYTTNQEPEGAKAVGVDGKVIWEANVHLEPGGWVPVKGYRAELYNLTVAGGNLFPTDAVFSGSELDETSKTWPRTDATVTGYIYNCYDESHTDRKQPISNVVPIPMY